MTVPLVSGPTSSAKTKLIAPTTVPTKQGLRACPWLEPELYPQVALGTVVPCKSTAEVTEAAEAGWISTMRPSRRPLRGLLRLRNFLNAIKNSPHAEGAHRARLEARTASMQSFFPVLRSAIVGG
jgi:hypothetical protein